MPTVAANWGRLNHIYRHMHDSHDCFGYFTIQPRGQNPHLAITHYSKLLGP
jgi:hypothetical protein